MSSDELLAAEFVLGLLEGEDLLAARARAQSDATFAEKITYWQDRLAPLADTIAPRTPRAELWPRIEAALASGERSGWKRKREDRIAAQEFAALAMGRWVQRGRRDRARLPRTAPAHLPGLDTDERLPTAVQQARLAATMPIEGTPLSLALTYLPEDDSLLVGAVGLQPMASTTTRSGSCRIVAVTWFRWVWSLRAAWWRMMCRNGWRGRCTRVRNWC